MYLQNLIYRARPEPGAPVLVTLTARSHRPIQAYTRRWPLFKRVHPILATYLPIDYPFSIPLLDCGRAIRSVAHTRKHTHTDPRSNVLPASGGVFSRPMHHTHTHVWRNLWGNHARGAFKKRLLSTQACVRQPKKLFLTCSRLRKA